jgi:hypothetical protein
VDSENITINYDGGSLTMVLGNAKDLFGDNAEMLRQEGEDVSIGVQSHPRTRVIGGGSVQVSSHNRTYTQWPTSQANNAAAGKVAMMRWQDSDGWWTIRYTGAAADLGTFLNTSSPKAVRFTTQRGTKYGPYVGEIDDD